ncbi:3-oxoacyl-[acyl-carrier-protein] reductase FabG [mine drainage metagenome]|uniref:3-oxoacyl-[acyl-carrier-protein] reductase FabG n=1 Tax=mine drainage metagenome TaxID=410659 RepID=A0A1J5RKY7_9ZZZZ
MPAGPFRSVLITGASSGLGEALALAYAEPGVHLALSGRDAARLEAVAARCRAQGAEAWATVVDVADPAAMTAWITEAEARAPLDLVIANAGISAGTAGPAAGDDLAKSLAIIDVNVKGVLNTVLPALPALEARRRGHIALMSSLAGFLGLGAAPAYCASKAAVRVLGESLHNRLAADNIGVSVICPGFVKSRITAQNRFTMPLLMEADAAARLIRRAIANNQFLICFPLILRFSILILSLMNRNLLNAITGFIPRKE